MNGILTLLSGKWGVRGVLHLDKMSTYSNKSVLPTFRIEPISQIFTGKG